MTAAGTAFAKVSLVGNPSDGYGGATLGLTATNFAATVTATVSDAMRFVDEGVPAAAELYGPSDATRLLEAAAVAFSRWFDRTASSCELRARTTIPRQVGLGGSSALVHAALDALARLHAVAIPARERVAMAMDIETRVLGIEAGLMDRVVQVHDGTLYLDCSEPWSVTPIDPGRLPDLFIAWRDDYAKLSSGGTLSPIARRFRESDPAVVEVMAELARLAARARDALLGGQRQEFLACMDGSMDQRLRLMPDMDPRYRALVAIGRHEGSHVTFPGSGGSVVGSFDDESHFRRLEKAYAESGANAVTVIPSRPRGDIDEL